MCGIIGAVSNRNIVPTVVDSLCVMEYRGYDSSGIAVIDESGEINRQRCVGKVENLIKSLENGSRMSGNTAIGHTRWATHGEASERNAHPLMRNDDIAVACNGIIENYEELRSEHIQQGCVYDSETDTEVIVHELFHFMESGLNLTEAVRETTKKLEGAFAIVALSRKDPGKVVATKRGSPLIIGIADGETFIASDQVALAKIAKSIMILENGDIAEISTESAPNFIDESGRSFTPEIQSIAVHPNQVDLAHYSHYMQKEIFEQGSVIANTLEGRISYNSLLETETFGEQATEILDNTQSVRILACGTSFYAALIARIWLESHGIACDAEIASEFRYRKPVVAENSLVVSISQSGETADTLAAQEHATRLGHRYSLAICNTPSSSLTRLTDLVLHTKAGPEIAVASTKAFTTQLVTLLFLVIALARRRGLSVETEAQIISELRALPLRVESALEMNSRIAKLAENFVDKEHTLFVGRGTHFPIALEGALKLKEISYIHAEAYPAGELKHGPLALVDSKTPTVAIAPHNHLLAKLKANIQEVRARGGKLYVLSDSGTPITGDDMVEVIEIVQSGPYTSPIIHTIALQLLAYHVAVIKGTNVDNPRNLAKSVTVE